MLCLRPVRRAPCRTLRLRYRVIAGDHGQRDAERVIFRDAEPGAAVDDRHLRPVLVQGRLQRQVLPAALLVGRDQEHLARPRHVVAEVEDERPARGVDDDGALVPYARLRVDALAGGEHVHGPGGGRDRDRRAVGTLPGLPAIRGAHVVGRLDRAPQVRLRRLALVGAGGQVQRPVIRPPRQPRMVGRVAEAAVERADDQPAILPLLARRLGEQARAFPFRPSRHVERVVRSTHQCRVGHVPAEGHRLRPLGGVVGAQRPPVGNLVMVHPEDHVKVSPAVHGHGGPAVVVRGRSERVGGRPLAGRAVQGANLGEVPRFRRIEPRHVSLAVVRDDLVADPGGRRLAPLRGDEAVSRIRTGAS